MPLPGTIHGQSDPFAPTQWSVILAAGRSQVNPEVAQAALGQLCQTYWAPLYTFVRCRGSSSHDAQDITQSFFAYLIEHKIYAHANREKGKFRSFLLASIKNFLSDSRDREQALKRGGGRESSSVGRRAGRRGGITFSDTRWFQRWEHRRPYFRTELGRDAGGAGLERVATDYKVEGKSELFEELKVFLAAGAEPLPTYDQLATRLGMPTSTLRSHVTRLRARYREALRAEVRRTVDTESEVDGELHELLRVLTRN